MLFQASAEKSDPTWATQKATNSPNTPALAATLDTQDKFGLMGTTPRGVQKSLKLALIASALRPMRKPIRISAIKESVLAEVKVFWIHFPRRSPRVFMKVSSTIIATATSCCKDRLIAYLLERLIGGIIQAVGEIAGTSTPRYRAKATPTAAMVPV